ncbi:hypothetical protein NC653_038900 [Populus alba x Populus x berolinensis]|uniref:Uncharacterized protein n=1 Tax=Populus alba x Populus x berolinensis TaxID=444605 RepID=A0AAD6PQQ7_9ROSI|nr:hypothetical protein NC653_038900 [Populus alba x Populus x berolinensis]
MTAVLCYSHHCFYFSSVFSQDDGLFPVALEGLLLPFHSRETLGLSSFLFDSYQNFQLVFFVLLPGFIGILHDIFSSDKRSPMPSSFAASELSGSSTAFQRRRFYLDRIP